MLIIIIIITYGKINNIFYKVWNMTLLNKPFI